MNLRDDAYSVVDLLDDEVDDPLPPRKRPPLVNTIGYSRYREPTCDVSEDEPAFRKVKFK